MNNQNRTTTTASHQAGWLKKLRMIIAQGIEAEQPDIGPATAPLPPAKGIWRVSLLVLGMFVVGVNLPFITRHCMVAHDSKLVLGIFDYMYSNRLFSGELPHWMAYGLHGLDARAFQIAFLSSPSYLTIFMGKLLGVHDSLALFSVTLCLEQLYFLLGMYLLSRWLFHERLTIFCVCMAATVTVTWQTQLFFNLRIFTLLPLAFYWLMRVRHERVGYCGWLVGIVCLLGPLGSTYSYLLWAFLLTVFSLCVFWGRFSSLKSMFEFRISNVISALCFFVLLALFFCSLWNALDNFTFGSPGRDKTGNVALTTYLTYGGNNLSDMISSLISPRKFMESEGGHAGMADYVGLLGLFCVPLALGSRIRDFRVYPFAITGIAIVALSLGGIFASVFYLFPGMHLFRHVGFLTGVIKMLVLILAGFGTDHLVHLLRHRTLIKRPTIGYFLAFCVALFFYLDLNLGGSIWATVCGAVQSGQESVFKICQSDAIYTIGRAIMMFIFFWSAWNLCRPSGSPAAKQPDFALLLLAICVGGDCLLFQTEQYTNYCRRETKFDFPAIKLDWPANVCQSQIVGGLEAYPHVSDAQPVIREISELGQFDLLPTSTLVKYQTWTNTPGAEYQAALSGALQWDPAMPFFRADWVAKNVGEMQAVLQKVSPSDLAIVSGFEGRKFRLLANTSAIFVKSDQEALKLLGSRTDWDLQVILTDPGRSSGAATAVKPRAESQITLHNFSADAFSLTVSNGMSEVAWLIYADAYAPGWHATVNEKAVPILKAYAAFKAIQVQPGISQVHFFYHDGLGSTCFDLFAILAGSGAAIGLGWFGCLVGKEILGR